MKPKKSTSKSFRRAYHFFLSQEIKRLRAKLKELRRVRASLKV